MVQKNNICTLICSVCVFSVFIFLSTYAQTVKQYSLDEVVKEAVSSNPEIIFLKKAFDAASARIPQAASLNDPTLEFEYDRTTDSPMKSVSISQDIPFPLKIYLRATIASKLAKMAYENYQDKENEIIASVKSAYAELALAYKLIEVNNENKGFLDQLSKNTMMRYSSGQGTQADALRSQVEIAKVDNQLVLLEQKRLSVQAKLNMVLNRDPKADFGIPLAQSAIKFSRTLDEFIALALNNNPELKAYHYAIDRGKAAYDLSINEFMPDFTLRFKEQIDKGNGQNRSWAGMVGVTVPLWFFQKQSFGVKEMKAELEMVKAQAKAKENEVLFKVNDAYARVIANKKLVELYETAFIPQAQEAVNVSLKGYEAQKYDLLAVIESQRTLIQFKLEHYQAILDLRTALADLEQAIGISIDF